MENNKYDKKTRIFRLFIVFVLFIFFFKSNIYAANSKPYKILLINSYHLGYKWSDDIYSGICTVFESQGHPYEIDIEYMDTQRIMTDEYLSNLKSLYSTKYRNSNYDIIIANDDAAYNFLRENSEKIFGLTPIVFCGVNSFNPADIKDLPRFTGVVETYDIEGTINLALEQNPSIKKIYYINDDSLTGISIMKEFKPVLEKYSNTFEFERLDGNNFKSILDQSKNLSNDSLILFLIYFNDRENNYFEYDEAISMLYNNCNRPIYGIWDFHLGHGILGGKLVSGYNQGELAAHQALQILNGKAISDIDVITEDTTSFAFDYQILNKFNISTENLPKDCRLINYERDNSLKILLLHSYNRDLQWTDDIERGIKENIKTDSYNIQYSIDYMDSKQHPSKIYLLELYDFLSKKYSLNCFDLVITSDDAAFNFITTYSNLVSEDTPIFFCGVNNKVDTNIINNDRITGVIETNDYKSTLEIMKEFHPERNKIIVINDDTLTGLANRKNLEAVIPYFENDLDFEFWSNLNMNELLLKCSELSETSSILLLSFNQDKSFNDFSYDESIKLIAENTDAPIYGVWDFYLGKGLVGGSVQSGYNQGATLAKMVTSYLNGTPISEIPIQESGLDEYQFDYKQLSRFDIPKSIIPKDSKIINNPYSIINYIQNNIVLFSIIILILLIIIILLLSLSILLSKKLLKQEKLFARTDKLTEIFNRRACFEILENQIKSCKESKVNLTICFADINRLKFVNDTYGHEQGDLLIKTISNIFKTNITKKDFLCRIGGDEFLFIFPGTNTIQAQEILTKINVELESINKSNKYPFILSFSYGFSSFDEEKLNNASELINYADKQMYEHKMKERAKNKN